MQRKPPNYIKNWDTDPTYGRSLHTSICYNIIFKTKLVDKGCVLSGITKEYFTIRSANSTMLCAA